jgi:hypothetical protein
MDDPSPIHLQITLHALQSEIPDRVKVLDVLEIREPVGIATNYDRHWEVLGEANGKRFTIKLSRPSTERFPYDEAIAKLLVFARPQRVRSKPR